MHDAGPNGAINGELRLILLRRGLQLHNPKCGPSKAAIPENFAGIKVPRLIGYRREVMRQPAPAYRSLRKAGRCSASHPIPSCRTATSGQVFGRSGRLEFRAEGVSNTTNKSLWGLRLQPTSHFGDLKYNQQVTMGNRKVAKNAVNYRVKIYHYNSLQYTWV